MLYKHVEINDFVMVYLEIWRTLQVQAGDTMFRIVVLKSIKRKISEFLLQKFFIQKSSSLSKFCMFRNLLHIYLFITVEYNKLTRSSLVNLGTSL